MNNELSNSNHEHYYTVTINVVHEISIVMMNITGHCKCEPRNYYTNDEHYSRFTFICEPTVISSSLLMNLFQWFTFICEHELSNSNHEHYYTVTINVVHEISIVMMNMYSRSL